MAEKRQREQIKCVVCGRTAWPSSLARGALGGYPVETLWLVKGLGRGKGIEWRKQNRDKDPAWIAWWINQLEIIIQLLQDRLAAIADEDDREELRETVQPMIVETTKQLAQARELARTSLLHKPTEIVVPKIIGA